MTSKNFDFDEALDKGFKLLLDDLVQGRTEKLEKVLKILNSVEGQKILESSKNFLKSSNNNFSLDNSLVRLQTETQNARLENVESETSQDEIEAQNDVEICENNSEEIFAKPQSVPKKFRR